MWKSTEEILDPKCGICGKPPIKKSSNHYFFKLSNFSHELKEWLNSNNNLQPDVKNYVLYWVNEGLQDWDITRDLEWGIKYTIKRRLKEKYFMDGLIIIYAIFQHLILY